MGKRKLKSSSDKITLLIDNRGFECTQTYVNAVIQLGIDKFTKEKAYAIIALKKKNVVMMKRDTFKTEEELNKQIVTYKKLGYFVTYVKGK